MSRNDLFQVAESHGWWDHRNGGAVWVPGEYHEEDGGGGGSTLFSWRRPFRAGSTSTPTLPTTIIHEPSDRLLDVLIRLTAAVEKFGAPPTPGADSTFRRP